MKTLIYGMIFATAASPLALSKPEAFEVDAERFGELPGGKEADGIVGDFILRNDLVEAVVSQNSPRRKANMGTFWGAGGTTQGCLYDLTLRGTDNDQLTIFAPIGIKGGKVSYVRVAEDSPKGEAGVEVVVTAAKGAGIYERHVYRIRDGWQGVLVTSTLKNETKMARTLNVRDSWTNFKSKGTSNGADWVDAIDPADKAGYAYQVNWPEGGKRVQKELKGGEEVSFERFIAVGTSPLQALGIVWERDKETGILRGSLEDETGKPIPTAEIAVKVGARDNVKEIKAYPDVKGKFSFRLPRGTHDIWVRDIGRPGVEHMGYELGEEGELKVVMEAASAVNFKITDSEGVSMPCKVQFNSMGDTPKLNLGPANRAHGCVDQYQSETGAFRVQVPPGKYRIVVTRGMEYSHMARELTVTPGKELKVTGKLRRLVDTSGWLSTDYHNHSTPSGDNTCGTPDRVINMAAEHLEFVPTTEHNRMFDWTPTIKALGLESFMATVPGIELTGSGAHFNSFPFKPDPMKQDGGAPLWEKDPRLNALRLRHFQDSDPDRWVHVNHPDMSENFVDWNGDGKVDGGYANLGSMLDALESQNYLGNEILAGVPYRVEKDINKPGGRVKYVREFIWLQTLNQGHRVWGIAVSDAHSVHGNGAGAWRTYVKSSTDEPAKADWRELVRHSKAGRMILTNGPYLEVETGDGALAGADIRAAGGQVDLKVKVQCTDWIDIDRVQVLVNGAQREDLNFTRKSHPKMFNKGVKKFDQVIPVELSQDAHLIVVATGENSTLITGYGSSPQSKMNPCAYNNPIFVDVDGNGFRPNGDTIGHPLPVKGLSADRVKELLGK